MSDTNDPSRYGRRRTANPLALPLVAVSLVAVIEAIVLAVVLSRGGTPPAATGSAPTAAAAPSSPADAAASSPAAAATTDSAAAAPGSKPAADADGVSRGKRGERVDSGGFGITVEEITDQPTPELKGMARVGPDERYMALLIAADNKTGGNADVYPVQFRIEDERGFGYDPLNLKVKMPALEWRTLGNRETVRGYVDFVLPKSAKGLHLIYTGTKSRPIRIDLGE
jgi:hypothetical protein